MIARFLQIFILLFLPGHFLNYTTNPAPYTQNIDPVSDFWWNSEKQMKCGKKKKKILMEIISKQIKDSQ